MFRVSKNEKGWSENAGSQCWKWKLPFSCNSSAGKFCKGGVCGYVCVHTHAHVHLWNMHNKVGKYRFNHNWLQRLNRVTKIAASLYFKFQKPSSERKLAQLNIKKYSKVTKAKPSWDIITSEYTDKRMKKNSVNRHIYVYMYTYTVLSTQWRWDKFMKPSNNKTVVV